MEQEKPQSPWYQVAEIELSYKPKIKPSERPYLNSPEAVIQLLRQVWDTGRIEMQEEFKVLLLNRANKLLGIFNASAGGITGTVADPRLILTAALKSNATSIILCHNHPSGCLKPSKADEELTLKIKCAAAFLDISVLDHIIITSESFFSFGEEGLL